MMHIWVDADACPRPIKQIIIRAARRLKIVTTFVSNQPLKINTTAFIAFVQVPGGQDVADRYILQNLKAEDLVITADIPLAAQVIQKQGFVLNPRGQRYDSENIGYFLSLRNFMDDLRSSGEKTPGPARLNQKDKENFANQFDQILRNKFNF